MSTRMTLAQVEAHNRRLADKQIPPDFGKIPDGLTRKYFMVKTAPVAAPRMTRRDKWAQRPVVQAYFEFRDKVRAVVGDVPVVPDELHCEFHIPMPDSWSEKKKEEMAGKPHRVRPDFDNLAKAVSDALFLQDGGIWHASQVKYWCRAGEERVCLTMVWR